MEKILNPDNDCNDYSDCSNCGQSSFIADMVSINDSIICPSCADDYIHCDRCEELLYSDDSLAVFTDSSFISQGYTAEAWCEHCYNNFSVFCAHCERRVALGSIYGVEGTDICLRCCDNEASYCEGCEERYFIENLNGDGYCVNCEEHTNPNEDGYRPSQFKGYKFYQEEDEGVGSLYYGIELETGTFDTTLANNWDEEILDKIPKELYTHYDCSIFDNGDVLQGVEIISQPMTYKWLKAHPQVWNTILSLRHKGLRSYSTGSCGMHIHLTKSYFTEDHLYKLMKMVYSFREFILQVSQRKASSLERWASVDDTEDLEQKAKDRNWCKKFTAVNLRPFDTIEIRIFRGTLGPLSFWKNIEFVEALVRFTKPETAEDLNVDNFLDFVCSNQEYFPSLYSWLSKKRLMPEKSLALLIKDPLCQLPSFTYAN